MKLDVKALAITFALLWGGCVLLVAVGNRFAPDYGGAFLNMMSSVYPGFHPGGLRAAAIGGLYAALDGAVCGALIAWIYNTVSRTAATA